MSIKHAFYAMVALTAAVLLYSLVLYPWLPDKIPIDWNWNGQVVGWGDKRWATFMMPGFMAFWIVTLPFGIILSIASNREVEEFEATYCYIMIVTEVKMALGQILILHAALHPDADVWRAMVGSYSIFFALIGNVIGKTRRNDPIGILTPWTLASEAVWIGTHRLAGRLMVAVGIIGVIAVWTGGPLGAYLMWLRYAAILWPAVYSYILYRRLQGNGPG